MKRTLLVLALLCVWAGATSAQIAPIPWLKPQFLDNSGNPCSGCLLYTYTAGTLVTQVTYIDPLGLFPNGDPVVLDSAGRAFVFTGPNAYKFVLTTATGATLWTVDNITNTALSLLTSNNTWTGSNTFNGAVIFGSSVIFNSGFTSNGPSLLTAGGTLSGTFLGNPIFAGTPNFTGGLSATTLTLSGQFTSTVATGTPPFVIASTTQIPNLDASQLEGCSWEIPCPLGGISPSTGAFTSLKAVNLSIGAGGPLTGIQGTDSNAMSAGTILGTAGSAVCLDANSGLTTNGCGIGASKIQSVTYCAAGCIVTGTPCSTTNNSFDTCDNSIAWPVAFADNNYAVTCSGINPVDGSNPTTGRVALQIASQSTISVTVRTVTLGATVSRWTQFDCTGAHN